MVEIIAFYLITIFLAMMISFISALTNEKINKILIVIGIMIIISIYLIYFGNFNIEIIYAFLIASIFIASLSGGIVSLFLIVLVDILILNTEFIISFHFIYLLLILLGGGFILSRFKVKIKKNVKLILNLTSQVKEMRALREISALLQETLDLDSILHIILSAVTAGYGLEFNRAILFLREEDRLYGKLGIGPLSKEDGLMTWQQVAAQKIDLDDMIEMNEEVGALDKELNDIIKEFEFDLTENNLASKVINRKKSFNIKEIDCNDNFQAELNKKLNFKAFAILPLIVQEKTIGILIVDNIGNDRRITHRDIDSLLPFANQAALAIENARLYELKDEMAIKDNLTNLYNQRYFQNSLEENIEKANEQETSFGLLMIDIDYFKVYNDNNGHPAGNEALTNLAKILKRSIREDDIVCRFGGEEFAVILPETKKEITLKVAERIRQEVEDYEFKHQEDQPNNNLTISVGAAIYPDNAQSDRELLNKADKALYNAKNSGRNLVKYCE